METCSTTLFERASSAPCCDADRDEASALRFRAVTGDDVDLLEYYFQKYPSRSCDFTVGGVLMWADYYEYEIAELEGTLLIKGIWPDSGDTVFYAPCGPMSQERFRAIVYSYCRRHGLKGMVLSPEERQPIDMGDGRPTGDGLMDESLEYLYDIDRFTGFSGRKMEKKRNHLNFFVNNYPFTTEVITEDMAAELISFTLAFSSAHGDDPLATYESAQVINVLRNFSEYPFFGIAIRHDGKIVGYSFGEAIGDTFIIHAEKGNIEYRGVYQAVASRLARAVTEVYPDVRYLNREDDMGYEHLRQSKLSYHPTLYVAKRTATV